MDSPTPFPTNFKTSPLFWNSPNTTVGDASTSFFDDTQPLNRVLFCATPQPWDYAGVPDASYEGDSISEVCPWPPTPSSIKPRHNRTKDSSDPDIVLDTSIDFPLSSTPPRGEISGERWLSRSPSPNPLYEESSIQSTPSRYSSAGRIQIHPEFSARPSAYSTSPMQLSLDELVYEESYQRSPASYFHLDRISEESIEPPVVYRRTFPDFLLELPPTPPKYKVQPPQEGNFTRGIPIFVKAAPGNATARDVLQAILDSRSTPDGTPTAVAAERRINPSSDPHQSAGPKRGKRRGTRGQRRKTSPGLLDLIMGK